ncbi:hypothetical protein BK133_16740 [Paenibacillus sp. FSL H8-0548]|uniref:DUF5722 domain-containing protein n=1 Tax=Paenibacillus sp. FSL H8-0548 TaxID=1920422 RepID=UPI00096FDEB6|nr:DUF5722 domain-containing protein [Paenibacillus sp. FSL H8-0548]OMF30781.1 hypothetical protein BK133_16740 [Paenibacillus sp. FSL H8-0548]
MNKRKKLISIIVTASFLLQLLIPLQAFAGAKEPGLAAKNSFTGSAIYPEQVINDFNTVEQGASWLPGMNAKKVSMVTTLANGPGAPFEGVGALEVEPTGVKAYTWRSTYQNYQTPLDLSSSDFLAVAANIWGWKLDDFFLKVTLTSGTETFEGVSPITGNKWTTIYFDIHNWAYKNSIDKIEFSYMKNYDLEDMSPGDAGYDSWTGRLQLDYLVATKVANLDFNAAGSTEGFSAVGGTLDVSNHALQYVITDPANTYIESSSLMLDTSKRNTVSLRMKNNTGASKLKISWITDQDQSWNEEKSMPFDVEDASDFTTFDFGIVNDSWANKIDKIRILPIGAAASKVLEIDKIDFSLKNLDVYHYQGKVDSSTISNDPTKIAISGIVNADYLSNNEGAEVLAYELPLYANEKTVNYAEMTPLASSAAVESFSLTFDTVHNGLSRIYSKLVVVLKNSSDEYVLADKPRYVTNPEALATNTEEYTPTKSIKGLQVQIPSDAERLGVQHGAINIDYDSMLTLSNRGASSIPYVYEGKTYYFIKNRVNDLDSQIKAMTDNGMAVSAILIAYRTRMNDADSPNKYIIHPDSTADGTVFAPNLTNEAGVGYYGAITSFIAERYSRPDKLYGSVMGYIVGNEVGQNKVWNNMGPKLLDEYVKQYERTVRLTYNIVKSKIENSRVYISLDHFWNAGESPDSEWLYDNKAIVDSLNKLAKEGGNYAWNVAFHPYPEDLFNPRTWADTTATNSFDTHRITFKNLQVLTDYLQQSSITFEGEQRRVILSEQGFHSGQNTLADQNLQAAAYAYAYYKVKSLPGIDAFIMHRHVDHAQEGGLNLGLWTNLKGQINAAGEEKVLYDVFKKIDTVDSLAVTEFAKSIIGVENWNDALPGFDPSQLETRPTPVQLPMGLVSELNGEISISNFDKDTIGWSATDSVTSVALDTIDKAAGASSLKAPVTGPQLKDLKGVTKTFDTPQDFTETPIIKASVKASGISAGEKAEFMIRVYSSQDQISEGSIIVEAGAWNDAALDLTGWEGIDNVERIKVWARPLKTTVWSTGALQVDEVSRAAFAPLTSLTVTLDRNEVVKVGDSLTLRITNNGNASYSGTVDLVGVNGITLDKSSADVTIASGQQVSIAAVITGINIPNNKRGELQVTIEGKDYVFVLTDSSWSDYVEDNGTLVFGDFEDAYLDGWYAGSETSSVASVVDDSEHHLYPKAAKHGVYMLEAAKSAKVATTESKVVKTFKASVNLSSYNKINFELYGWGGVSSAYLAKIRLVAEDGTFFNYEKQVDSNVWNSISVDISSFDKRNQVKSIEISYRGKDTAVYTGPWGGFFYIDHVRTGLTNYTVQFNTNGAAAAVSNQTVEHQGKAAAPYTPIKEGYRFDGWYTDNVAFEQPFDFANTPITGNITLYAKWSKEADLALTVVSVSGSVYGNQPNYSYGDTVRVNALPNEGYRFVSWSDHSSGRVLSTNLSYSFIITSNTSLIANYAKVESDLFVVQFVSESGQILSVQQVQRGESATAPMNPSKPDSQFIGWNASFTNVQSDLILRPVYSERERTYTLTVEGGIIPSGITEYSFDSKVTIEANAPAVNEQFSHWLMNGGIVSYTETYSFYITGNTTITAVYSEVPVVRLPVVAISHDVIVNPDTLKMSFIGQINVTPGFALVEAGLVLKKSSTVLSELNFGTEGVIRAKSSSQTSSGQYMMNKTGVNSGETWYASAYLVYKDSTGHMTTIYSDVASGTMP